MPLGFVKTEWSDPRNFTLAEWQQAKRAGKDASRLKAMLQERWAVSASKASFAHALEEQGFILAKGNRRGIVAVDHDGEAYAITRWVGLKAKQVRARLGEPDDLPSVAEARNKAAQLVAARLKELEREQEQKAQQDNETAAQELKSRRTAQKRDLLQLQMRQKKRERKAEQQRQARIRKGLLGFIDRLTGKRKKMLALNKAETEQAQQRDQAARVKLRADQNKAMRVELKKIKRQINKDRETRIELQKDILWLETPFKNASEGKKPVSRSRRSKRNRDMPDREPAP